MPFRRPLAVAVAALMLATSGVSAPAAAQQSFLETLFGPPPGPRAAPRPTANVAARPSRAQTVIGDAQPGFFQQIGALFAPQDTGRGMEGRTVPAQFRRQTVAIDTRERPGTIIIDTARKYLFYVVSPTQAVRYGVGVGRDGFGWHGTVAVGRKAEWPGWTPPAAMRARQPGLPTHMPGGPDNPLGARAMYLYRGGADTLFRIHGTNQPWTIGLNVSSGCIRMMNADVIDLYNRARVGAKVIVL